MVFQTVSEHGRDVGVYRANVGTCNKVRLIIGSFVAY
jgi:hypothetical protein